MNYLGKKREKILEYICNRIANNEGSPSIHEIMEACGMKGIGNAVYHLNWLEKNGYIKREKGKRRNIKILQSITDDSVNLPLAGTIKAGSPNIAQEDIETYLTVPKSVAKNDKDYFLLRVDGDSMINAGVCPGDIVVIKKGENVADGDIVVAVIGEDATLKRLIKAQNGWILKPENNNYQPIIINNLDEMHINGKVVGKIVPKVITDL